MTDTLFDIVKRISKTNNENMKFYKKSLENMSDSDIRKIYKENRENMFKPFEEILHNYKNHFIPDNLTSINGLREEINNPDQIKQLDECEKLEKESLKIIDEILDIFEKIMKYRLNNAIIGKLEDLSREKIKENKIEPITPSEKAVLEELYKGGLRKSSKRKNNKKYTKNRTYEISKKYVSKKNKTRKLKKNYL